MADDGHVFRGPSPVLKRARSSRKITSNTQCRRFSTRKTLGLTFSLSGNSPQSGKFPSEILGAGDFPGGDAEQGRQLAQDG